MSPDLVAPRVHRFQRHLPKSGFVNNMLAVELPSGGLLLHSPTWLGEGTFDAVDALGEVRVLLAPNHFHHLSLPRFRERYPKAIAVASEAAIPRLLKKGHAGVAPLAEAAALLPEGAHFLEPQGLSTGEAWVSLPGDGGPTWLVCDAWFHVRTPLRGFEGAVLRALATGPGLRVGRTFKWLAVRDRAAYVEAARGAIEREKPAILVPSHGDPIVCEGTAEAHALALASLAERLG